MTAVEQVRLIAKVFEQTFGLKATFLDTFGKCCTRKGAGDAADCSGSVVRTVGDRQLLNRMCGEGKDICHHL